MTRIPLFQGRDGHYLTYRIPILAAYPSGRVLLFCDARDGIGDWGKIDIILRASDDNGQTWDEPRLAFGRDQFPEGPVNNLCVALDETTGVLHGIVHHCYERVFHFTSEDEGRTFSGLRDITASYEAFKSDYDYNVCATGPTRGVQLKGGRLIFPVWLSTGGHTHRPSVIGVMLSDDHGATWRRGPIVAGETDPAKNPNESLLVELGDGRLLMNIRNESDRYRRLVCISEDGGDSWGTPYFDDALYEPICNAAMMRLRDGRIVFSNPDSRANHRVTNHGTGVRENLCIKVSADDCRTWSGDLVVEPGIAGYSALAQAGDGTVLCAFEHGGIGGNHYDNSALSVARIAPDELP